MKLSALLLLIVALSAHGNVFFDSPSVTAEGQDLKYRDASGRIHTSPRVEGQVRFSGPRVSANGRFLGWLAEFPTCCTSYPVALQLVVMDKGKRLTTFSGPQAIFGWCFSPNSRAVVYRQEALHGPTDHVFEMRSVRSGNLIRRFVLPLQGPESQAQRGQLPNWAKCAAYE